MTLYAGDVGLHASVADLRWTAPRKPRIDRSPTASVHSAFPAARRHHSPLFPPATATTSASQLAGGRRLPQLLDHFAGRLFHRSLPVTPAVLLKLGTLVGKDDRAELLMIAPSPCGSNAASTSCAVPP